jgi:tetratricopeptide (TPR) repeat protein
MRIAAFTAAALSCAVLTLSIPAQKQAAPESALAQAEQAYAQRADPAQAKNAMELFKKASEENPKSYDAFWKGAKACYFYGEYTRSNARDKEKMAIFQDGIDRAKAAVALKPDGVEGHYWLGVLYGVYGEAKGIFKSLSLVPDIKQEMNTCLKLDPTVECYGPDRLLGRMYYKLPWFKGGSNKKSIEYLEKAVKGCPANDLSRYYLAVTYEDEHMDAKAREQLKAILDHQPDPRWAAEYPSIKARAEKLMKKVS